MGQTGRIQNETRWREKCTESERRVIEWNGRGQKGKRSKKPKKVNW